MKTSRRGFTQPSRPWTTMPRPPLRLRHPRRDLGLSLFLDRREAGEPAGDAPELAGVKQHQDPGDDGGVGCGEYGHSPGVLGAEPYALRLLAAVDVGDGGEEDESDGGYQDARPSLVHVQ